MGGNWRFEIDPASGGLTAKDGRNAKGDGRDWRFELGNFRGRKEALDARLTRFGPGKTGLKPGKTGHGEGTEKAKLG